MRLTDASVLAMLPATGLAACSTAYPADEISGTLLRTVVLDMGNDAANVTAAEYDQYFEQGSALEGVEAVIAASQFYINLWAIPGTEAAFRNASQCLTDGYPVNQVPWLYYNATTASWWGGYEAETEADSYDDAALSVVTGLIAGHMVRFWDTNGDGYTDLIDADYIEGFTIDTVTVAPRDLFLSFSLFRKAEVGMVGATLGHVYLYILRKPLALRSLPLWFKNRAYHLQSRRHVDF
ncbi:hypothetical protein INS49_003177 [Diaporthe citri]|uniref:uncharacterized protein n=1 Tax=Diaporthe citri TaxID=83186 RepID=UPI001C827B4E|nr:uncharacterized protein INS49_003177 [Diaporthe citri]KAG6368958.1 hypothetical protein INS49_003177 [Diaporthe citri]